MSAGIAEKDLKRTGHCSIMKGLVHPEDLAAVVGLLSSAEGGNLTDLDIKVVARSEIQRHALATLQYAGNQCFN
ncbi:hypothetical protein OAF97_01410 [Akkermansiaceae bacterium]|nr:hypothetical protein [Akkermansiaceae bacterium]